MTTLAHAAAVSALVAGAAAGEPRASADPIANVVLVSVDSLRADHLALYGYPRATTPFLDARARERGAVVFERMVAVAPSCHPAHPCGAAYASVVVLRGTIAVPGRPSRTRGVCRGADIGRTSGRRPGTYVGTIGTRAAPFWAFRQALTISGGRQSCARSVTRIAAQVPAAARVCGSCRS